MKNVFWFWRLSGIVAWLGLFTCGMPAQAGVNPLVAGNGANDSVWVEFAVNDTLGNATDADSAWVIRFYRQWVVDSCKVSSAVRPGFYRQAFKSTMHPDSLGGYSFNIRVFGATDRAPHTTYGYTVLDGGPVGLGEMGRLIADSNLAREATKTDYQNTTGPGAIPVYLYCLDAQDSTSIQGVKLSVKLAADYTPKHRTISAGDGWAAMTLEEYDHLVYATANGYTFAVPACTLVVFGDSLRDTIWAIPFDPGEPGSPELCRVHGWVYDVSGSELSDARITARLLGEPARFENVIVSPYEKSTSTDSSGYWFLDLLPSVCLTPDTTVYEFTVRHSGEAILRKKIAVPDTSGWRLSW